MAKAVRTEIYVRFQSEKYGNGIFEGACQSIEEAAGQFVEDADSVSAMRITLNDAGRMIAGEDVTDEVVEHLKQLISDDTYTICPHPIVEDFFNEWQAEAEREAEDQAEHERIESAMIHI